MNYQSGQAVIYWGKRIAFFYDKYDPHYGYTLQQFNGKLTFFHSIDRAATEAEILAEIHKHGWELADIEYITGKHINLIKTNRKGWVYGGGSSISTENLKELSNEGLQASRIITALNLAK